MTGALRKTLFEEICSGVDAFFDDLKTPTHEKCSGANLFPALHTLHAIVSLERRFYPGLIVIRRSVKRSRVAPDSSDS